MEKKDQIFGFYSSEVITVGNPTKEQRKKAKVEKLSTFRRDNSVIIPNPNRICVVAKYNEEDKSMNFAVSKCSSKDIFIKKKGRGIAITRLNSGQIYLTTNVTENPGKTFLNVAKYIVEEVKEKSANHQKLYNFK